MSTTQAIQRELYNAIVGLGIATYDFAPQRDKGGTFPYVEVGSLFFAPFDTYTEAGFDFAWRLHVWSKEGSAQECRTIQQAIYDRLHNGPFVVLGFNSVLLQRQTSQVMRMPDGVFHGVCEYRGLMETE